MNFRFSLLSSICGLLLLLTSCKRELDRQESVHNVTSSVSKAGLVTSLSTTSSCVEDQDLGNGYDSLPIPTILGNHLVNHPYSLATMQQAYTNLYGSANGVSITHKYVRFKPATQQELSSLEELDIDLFDYPLDYDVVQEGDYYDDGVTPTEEISWLYAVVSANFTPPAGITYEVLEQIHVPTLAAVENEAFRITGNPIDNSACSTTTVAQSSPNSKITPQMAGDCPAGYVWDAIARRCVSQGPPPPPAPTPTRQPSGTITVFDTQFTGSDANRPVRNARVVAKRFLKIERTYTNNQGQFFLNKEFNKVHLLMKCKNDQAKIRALRRARLWQILFPVKMNFGKFKGALNNLSLNIGFNSDARSRGARFWAAATAHNTVQEFRDYAAQQGIGIPPNTLRVLLTNWRLQGVSGATPMYAKRFWQTLPSDFLTTFVISSNNAIAGGLTALAMVLKSEVDVTVGYNLSKNDVTANSDQLSEVMFHEQTHAAHYNKVGNAWWQDFVNSEFSEMIAPGPFPYGDGTTTNSPIIALGESWAYHMGHFMTDVKYGVNSGSLQEQGINYLNNNPVFGLSSHLNLLEDFSPYRTYDPFHWIPQGLYYDLIDGRNEQRLTGGPVDDNVSNYSNQQLFNALQADIYNLQTYQARLLQTTANSSSAFVPNLFSQYGY